MHHTEAHTRRFCQTFSLSIQTSATSLAASAASEIAGSTCLSTRARYGRSHPNTKFNQSRLAGSPDRFTCTTSLQLRASFRARTSFPARRLSASCGVLSVCATFRLHHRRTACSDSTFRNARCFCGLSSSGGLRHRDGGHVAPPTRDNQSIFYVMRAGCLWRLLPKGLPEFRLFQLDIDHITSSSRSPICLRNFSNEPT